MKDASVRVLTSAAAALLVFVIVSATATLSVTLRIIIALATAGAGWCITAFLGRGGAIEREGSYASRLSGENVAVRNLRIGWRRSPKTIASDIRAKRDVTIDGVEDGL